MFRTRLAKDNLCAGHLDMIELESDRHVDGSGTKNNQIEVQSEALPKLICNLF